MEPGGKVLSIIEILRAPPPVFRTLIEYVVVAPLAAIPAVEVDFDTANIGKHAEPARAPVLAIGTEMVPDKPSKPARA